MKKIKIFLASSNTLLTYREQIQLKIATKNKLLTEKDMFLHLVKWEDLTARVQQTRSQNAYNMQIKTSDLFILLASDSVGQYTEEEFDIAQDSFKRIDKPYMLTYFERTKNQKEDSLINFQKKLVDLEHFYAPFNNFEHLWNQINDEIDTLISEIEQDIALNQTGKAHKQLGNLPINPTVFIGREGILENIYKAFFDEHKPILLLNGNGGIGKTTTASAYYHKYQDQYAHLIWTITETGIDDAIISLMMELNIKVNFDTTKKEQVQLVLKKIASLQNPSLLIIDNADSFEDLQNNYQSLLSIPKIHILITSRIGDFEFFEKYHIDKLSPKNAKALFVKYYKKFDEQTETNLLTSIFKAIDYNTLVIELLAKNTNQLNRIKKNYSLEKLLHDLQTKGVLGISQSKAVNINYQNLQATKPEEVVKAMYVLTALNQTEKSILSVFAVLPALNIPFADLEEILQLENLEDILYQLYEKSWLDFDEENTSFKINPIVAEVIRLENKKTLFKDCSLLIEKTIDNIDCNANTGSVRNYKKTIRFILYGENLFTHLYREEYKLVVVAERIATFNKNYKNLSKALYFFEEVHKLSKKLYIINPDNIDLKEALSISYERLGNIHQTLGNLNKTIHFYEECLRLRKEIYESQPNNINFKDGLAYSYINFGDTYQILGNLDKALMSFEEYCKLRKEIYESQPNSVIFKEGLAVSYERLGNIHLNLRDLNEALHFFEECLRLRKEIYESQPNNINFKNGLAYSYGNLGLIHKLLGNLNKSLKYFEDTSNLIKELYKRELDNVFFKKSLATSYSSLGEIHTSLGNIPKALQYFEVGLTLTKELYKSQPSNIGFKNSLAVSYNELSVIYLELKQCEKSKEMAQFSYSLLKELITNYPKYIKHQNNFIEAKELLDAIKEKCK